MKVLRGDRGEEAEMKKYDGEVEGKTQEGRGQYRKRGEGMKSSAIYSDHCV